jgi:hypothetical protein
MITRLTAWHRVRAFGVAAILAGALGSKPVTVSTSNPCKAADRLSAKLIGEFQSMVTGTDSASKKARTNLNLPVTTADSVVRPYLRSEVDKEAMPAPGYRGPRYPESLQLAGIDGAVIATFVMRQ